MLTLHEMLLKVQNVLSHASNDFVAKAKARQFLFSVIPLSRIVENYLYDNEGRPQSLEKFKMMRFIYDNLPQRLLLKCSRKTLKSTLISNVIAVNMFRYSYYKMLYIAPQELSTKGFSNQYLNARLDSPPLKKILAGFEKNDVFEKILKDTSSSVILRYCSEDATRIRGPATDQNIMDEVQDISFEVLPIIKETMALSHIKREVFAGTPLTTDNTINELWKVSSQCEWYVKCTGCNHWNSLTLDNEPVKMILKEGISCSKCSKLLDTDNGEWVQSNPGKNDLVGYHLAQPILTHFNQDPKEWLEIYNKVHGTGVGRYSPAQVYNEVFGLAYDTGSKPVTEEQLKKLCQLGEMMAIYEKNRSRYQYITCGVDWGVSMDTSRTAVCMGGLRDDWVYEVFFIRVYHDVDYEKHIFEIAALINSVGAFAAADSGPDPARGRKLGDLTSWDKTQLVRYDAGKLMQHYDVPTDSVHRAQNRWCLHRSDTMTFVYDLLKKGQILFPRWEDSSEALNDILNVYVEVRQSAVRRELFYRHPATRPDDFFHALNFAACQAHLLGGDPLLSVASSTDNTSGDFSGGSSG